MNISKRLTYLLSFLLILTLMSNSGCNTSKKNDTANLEQTLTENNQQRLLKSQPPVKLDWSLERDNINRRTKLWNEKTKVSYIYLIDHGNVLGYYSIKGKVSSVNSQITNPERAYKRGNAHGHSMIALPSPAEDGSYGTNGDGVFFFTTDGVYAEWNGTYLLTDHILPLNVPNFAKLKE